MGNLWSKFEPSTLEKLESLDKEITALEDQQKDVRVRQRHYAGYLIIYSAAAYFLAGAIVYFYFYPKTPAQALITFGPFVLFPGLIWGARSTILWIFMSSLESNERKLSILKKQKRELLNKVKDTETYKVAAEILERFGDDDSPSPSQRNLRELNEDVIRRRSFAAGQLRHRGGIPTPALRTPRLDPHTPAAAAAGGAYTAGQTPRAPPPTPATATTTEGGGRFAPRPQVAIVTPQVVPSITAAPGPPGRLPRPILEKERTFMDKMADFVLGDGPNNRFALICSQCHGHNGMALAEEFPYLSYRCCYCFAFNSSKGEKSGGRDLSTPAFAANVQNGGPHSFSQSKEEIPQQDNDAKSSAHVQSSSKDDDASPKNMPSLKVNVKWGKEKFNLDLNTEDPPEVFKAQLFALTGVEPSRQKVMYKAKTLGEESWNGFPELKEGAQLMLMGSAGALPTAPTKKTVFIEDLKEGEMSRALKVPVGLVNMGNTCYMNATLQCLKTVPELTNALNGYQGNLAGGAFEPSKAVTVAVRDLYNMLESCRTGEVTPLLMVQVLHMAFPRFAEKGERGENLQQDANECWVELLRMLQQRLKEGDKSIINQYFYGKWDITWTCKEDQDEPPKTTQEDFPQISCFLSADVKYLQSGIRSNLTSDVEKRSEKLGRDALYEKKALISRLPGYLNIQMMRFFYKGGENQTNAKILKDVKYSYELDMYDFCTPELQQKLVPMRTRFKEASDLELEENSKFTPGEGPTEPTQNLETIPYWFTDDPGSNNSGFYELQAVLTHKGRTSGSGHYVAWVRLPPSEKPTGAANVNKSQGAAEQSQWVMCDDEHVNPVTFDDIVKLSGGGDWHVAYILLFGPKILKAPKVLVEKWAKEDAKEASNGVDKMQE